MSGLPGATDGYAGDLGSAQDSVVVADLGRHGPQLFGVQAAVVGAEDEVGTTRQ